jgi:indolepyruvate ferredoxin oxidoreductase
MRITGIGGTGIVTVAQVLATAAAIDGRQVRALDQTGLAQKGGAVVSDLTMTRAPAELASKLGAGRCDLYLGCDALVASDGSYLVAADPDRTIAVVSVTEIPTGAMVTDTAVAFPEQSAVRSAVDAATADACYLDAGTIARQGLDDEQYANMVMVGAAYQRGALPLTADVIEQAITLNGVAVAANLQAFRLGRQAIAEPATAAATAEVPEAAPGSDLDSLLAVRIADLIGYQGEGYARQYAEFVREVRATEAERLPGSREGATAITEAVARSLHKLMAYKDEYEVARLALDPAFDAQLAAEFGPGSRVSYRLHPPVLRALGRKQKITLGPWFRPAFRVLRAGRRLRGTPADVFGYTSIRRTERSLITEYRDTMTQALTRLDAQNRDLVARIATLPDMIRGYEHVKLGNLERYRAELAALQAELAQPRGTLAGAGSAAS